MALLQPLAAALLGFGLFCASCPGRAGTPPESVAQALRSGRDVVVIVDYDATQVERELAPLRARLPRGLGDRTYLETTRTRYRALKAAADALRPIPDADVLQDHSHLPMRNLRLRSPAALAALAAHPGVAAIHPDGTLQRVLAESLPLVGQPAAASVGHAGAGTTVAVIDDGIDLANPAFGCTAVGQPAGCRVIASRTFVASPGSDNSHGTNVAATAAAVAGQASIAMLNVFSSSGATFADVITAINWAIANRSAYEIVAINMSLGDTGHFTSPCSAGNSFVTPVANARAAGIGVVAAAGNLGVVNGGFTPGLARPACTPGVLSVGAVYDASLGGLTWGASPNQCTDASAQPDRIACFSQSATYLGLLAPGALVTAGGILKGGTSQAAPHAAGALAAVRAAFADETLAQAEARLRASAVQIADTRIGTVVPRLSLPDALRPANDAFAQRRTVAGANGSATGSSRLATREAGEPAHGTPGSASVWWTWTAPAAGQVTLGTAGSGFDTTLAVYTGAAVSALTAVASDDNGGAAGRSLLWFQAQPGTTYHWAVDGTAASSGDVALQWTLNGAAVADLSASVSAPAVVVAGMLQPFVLVLHNAGPQTATHAALALALPAGVTVSGAPPACLLDAGTLRCTTDRLLAGESVAWTVELVVPAAATTISLTATARSDVPDGTAANDSGTLVAAVAAAGDVPLPAWAVVLLGGALMAGLRRVGRT